MGQPVRPDAAHPALWREANAGNRNIPVPAGEENNSDSPSSGERPGISPNRGRFGAPGVVGRTRGDRRGERNGLERPAVEGDSPLREARAAPVRT